MSYDEEGLEEQGFRISDDEEFNDEEFLGPIEGDEPFSLEDLEEEDPDKDH